MSKVNHEHAGSVCLEPAAFIVQDFEGLESWTCAHHANRPRWILRTPFADWFVARGLETPAPESHRCPERIDRLTEDN